jgi:hypothetical protein
MQGSATPKDDRIVRPAAARPALPPRPPADRRPAAGEGGAPTIYRRERNTGRMLVLGVATIVVIALVALLLSSVLGSGKSSPSSSTSSGTTTQSGGAHARRHGGASVGNASLRVAVLNATQTNGLAAKVASSLKSHGYSQATALFGTPGAYPVTTVEYASGHAREAAGVARALNVPSADVKPLQSSAAPLSGGAPVVVIVGEATANEGAGGAPKTSESSAAESEQGGETANGGETAAGSQAAEPGA